MKRRCYFPVLFWALGIELYSGFNYLRGEAIEISFFIAWTVAAVVYGFMVLEQAALISIFRPEID